MFKRTLRFSGTIMLRTLNVLSNAVSGIVLARQLSLESRGHVAVISSMIGVAVVLLSSPKGEEILRNHHKSNFQVGKKEISLNLTHLFVTVSVALLWIYKATNGQFSTLWFVAITIIIFASSVNSLEQAFLYHRVKFVGNQVIMSSHALLLLLFLLIFFHTLGSGVESWLIAFVLAELILLACMHKLNAGIRINIDQSFLLSTGFGKRWYPGSKLERFSVYQAAFFIPILTIFVSAILAASSLALFAVGISLASLVSLPVLPFLPHLLTKAQDVVVDFRSMTNWKKFFILFFLISFVYFTSVLFEFFIPMFYGAKYIPIVHAVPIIVFTGLMLAGLNTITTIFRGTNNFQYSAVVNFLALAIFCTGLVTTGNRNLGIQAIFICLLIGVSIAFIVGFFLLFSRKKFHFQI
jgi:O-antigen/teichoic acid export membrane protein